MEWFMNRETPRRLRRLQMIHSFRDRPVFFVTACTAKRKQLLATDDTHEAFLSFCSRSPDLAQVWVGRYILMPDHLHAFVSAEGSQSLSRWTASLKKFMSSRWRQDGLEGPFWQKGFFDHVLRSGESYSEKWDYVSANPVRAGLAQSEDEWPYAGEVHVLAF